MKTVTTLNDANGKSLKRGDMVTTLTDQVTSKIVELASDMDTGFVRLKPVSYSVGKGVWHASEHVLFLRSGS
ncbi:MAG TPA: hypothetical protein DCM28_04635 [Phycisphaerales bacterium]|nr:hypothetical protein [Phycisphaerales bacterium]HCD33303.1 hypothetical protein [Phycisphaerales bacterium]|tara:strand:+ start:473 stop:688 length:216 start_codon:yes stop_codon:yes gene_type:complete